MTRRRPVRRSVRRGVPALVVLVGLAGAAGCGIRATTVPVDVGAAPSRVSCDTPAQPGGPSGAQEPRATVELVCGSQLVGVERVVRVPEKRVLRDPVALAAQALLAALGRTPSTEERDAGFTTGVPDELTAVAPRPGDPAGTVRLSRKPEDLPPVALAQVVCTLSAADAVSPGPGPVVLGGPDTDPPRSWECTDAVRSRPESIPTLGELARPAASSAASPSAPPPAASVSAAPGR